MSVSKLIADISPDCIDRGQAIRDIQFQVARVAGIKTDNTIPQWERKRRIMMVRYWIAVAQGKSRRVTSGLYTKALRCRPRA